MFTAICRMTPLSSRVSLKKKEGNIPMYDWIQFCTSTFLCWELWWSLGGCATIFSGTNICSYPKFIFFLLRNHHEPLGPAPDILRNAQSSGVGGAFTVACSWKLEQTLGLSKKIKVIMKRTKIQKPNKTLAPFFPPKKVLLFPFLLKTLNLHGRIKDIIKMTGYMHVI